MARGKEERAMLFLKQLHGTKTQSDLDGLQDKLNRAKMDPSADMLCRLWLSDWRRRVR